MKILRQSFVLTFLAILAALATSAPLARANVYASNIKLNGALANANVSQGSSVNISYILNEPASSGVTIKIYSGATAVRTLNVSGGGTGALKGSNTVVWDGKNDANAIVPPGNYSITITAATAGYTVWTQTTSDTDPGSSVSWPSGIAADQNTNSPYYGRIVVCNGVGSGEGAGIVKLNADGSLADEGQSTAGYAFAPDGYLGDCCRSLKTGSDDRLYFNDWTGIGKIVACDMIMSTNQVICDGANFPFPASGGNYGEIDIANLGTTNAMAYFTDSPSYPSLGVWAFPLTNNGIADPTFPGIQVVATGGADLPLRAGFGLAVDDNFDICIGQTRGGTNQSSPRLCCISNWVGAASLPIVDDQTNWNIGAFDDSFRYVSSVAIDSRANPKFVAAGMNGATGGIRVVNFADGSVVTNVQSDGTVFFIATGWDNVGNLYGGTSVSVWRAFSPPGANQATTPSVWTVRVSVPIQITSISVSGATSTVHFTGDPAALATDFTLLSSATVAGPYTPAAGASITGSAGAYTATAPTTGPIQFYRIKH